MRASRAAFQALLLAMRTWHQITFRPGAQMHDQPDWPDEPTEERHGLRVFRVPVFGVVHDEDTGENPGTDHQGDEENVAETAGHLEPEKSRYRGGRGRSGGGIDGSGGAGMGSSSLRQNGRREKEPGRRCEQTFHRAEMLRAQGEQLSTQ